MVNFLKKYSIMYLTMEKCPKSTPFSLNNFSLTNSHNAFEDMSLAFGENIFAESKDIELITGDLGFGVLKPFFEQLCNSSE